MNSRKGIIRALPVVAMFAAAFTFGGIAHAEESHEPIRFTESLAIEYANDFIDAAYPNVDASAAEDALRLFGSDGSSLGYVVDYVSSDGSPNGYIVFDVSDETLISEFSVEEDATSPVKRAALKVLSSSVSSETAAVKTAPYSYDVVDTETGDSVDEYGIYAKNDYPGIALKSSAPNGTWTEPFLTGVGTTSYTIASERYSVEQPICFSEPEVEAATGSYACAVVAMLNCVPHYTGMASFPWLNWAPIFDDLWNRSGTYVDRITNGIRYGLTQMVNIGPAFTSYCASQGVSVSYSDTSNPSYQLFVNNIEAGDVSIFSAGINVSGSRVGHSMAVEGYAILVPWGGGNTMYSLVVADGWGQIRHLNYNYSKWTDTYGTFFHA